jgi:hypothetical protein
MYCIECGTKLPNNSKFCPNCGTKVSNDIPPTFVEPIHNIEIPLNETNKPTFDYNFLKKSIGWYSAWVLLQLGLLLIAADEIISDEYINDRFWPFSNNSDVSNYDIREFIVFTIFPLAIIIIWSMIHPIDSINPAENIDLVNTTEIVNRKTVENITLKIVSVNSQSIGAEVFIDEQYAPDGKYDYLEDNRSLIVRNGRIEKLIQNRFDN